MENDYDRPGNPYFECIPTFMLGLKPENCTQFYCVDGEEGYASSGYIDEIGDIFVERILKVIK